MTTQEKKTKVPTAQSALSVSIRKALQPRCNAQSLSVIYSNAENDGSHLVQVGSDLRINVLETGEVRLNGKTQESADAAVNAARKQIDALKRRPAV
jgi:hypothetical protein